MNKTPIKKLVRYMTNLLFRVYYNFNPLWACTRVGSSKPTNVVKHVILSRIEREVKDGNMTLKILLKRKFVIIYTHI